MSLHIPAGPSTAGIVDRETHRRDATGSAILINTSRADVVDSDALLDALNDGRVRAGLDVFPDEPGTGTADWTSPLSTHPAVVGTHHIGASTEQAQLAVAEGVVDVVAAFAAGAPIHVVNPAAWSLGPSAVHAATGMTLVRPFPARIVKEVHAADVVCPMHDALSAAQRANLLLENPLSYLNVTRSALDMPGASYDDIGAANAAGLERLLRSDSYGGARRPCALRLPDRPRR